MISKLVSRRVKILTGLFAGWAVLLFAEDGITNVTDGLEHGQFLNKLLISRSLVQLEPYFSETDFSYEKLSAFSEQVSSQVGVESRLLNERIITGWNDQQFYKYTRYSEYSKTGTPVCTVFGFKESGKIYEFSLETLPAEYDSPYDNYQTSAKLELPFEGEWYVVWGGRPFYMNNHAASRDQRFACDFTVLLEHCMYENDGSRNSDFYAYGRPILAPASGVIVHAVDTVPENIPGQMTDSPGNMVVIDHGNSEYSFLCHLQHHSVKVKPGQNVRSGEFIARCGNSGHSTAPGLHYHLQNTPELYNGEGLPAQFNNYTADSRDVSRGEPQWNQYIKQHRK